MILIDKKNVTFSFQRDKKDQYGSSIYTGLPKIGSRFFTKKLGISCFRQTALVQKIGNLTISPNRPCPKNRDFYDSKRTYTKYFLFSK